MVSLDFHELMELKRHSDEEGIYQIFLGAANTLSHSGIDLLALCANTAHQRAERLEREVGIPLVHIVDATAAAIKRSGLSTVGLLGTRPTMEESFFKDRLTNIHGVHVLTPSDTQRREIDRYIFDEMVVGKFSEAARQQVVQACLGLTGAGAQGIVLGCTELPELMHDISFNVPLFDTTTLHAKAIVAAALT